MNYKAFNSAFLSGSGMPKYSLHVSFAYAINQWSLSTFGYHMSSDFNRFRQQIQRAAMQPCKHSPVYRLAFNKARTAAKKQPPLIPGSSSFRS
jgi:hypothetical protein